MRNNCSCNFYPKNNARKDEKPSFLALSILFELINESEKVIKKNQQHQTQDKYHSDLL